MSDEVTGAAKGLYGWLSGPAGQLAVAGAAGGIVRSITLRERPLEGLGSLIVGMVCSIYVSPLAQVVFEPLLGKLFAKPDALSTFSGFVTGVGGMAVVGFVLDMWRARRAQANGPST